MNIICYGDSNTYGYDPRSWLGGRYGADSRCWTLDLSLCKRPNGLLFQLK